ncbi:CMP-sialic acid transporter 1-like [Penaeus japonicus]|uniref:CMP-sialic acid transporter 1-like n=1 Tax=Penaeus japonicus TaxID=27405 RepID=UPI001C710430|nr:CMP-sialic acid transporter 1-like [Penaeus japonicus]
MAPLAAGDVERRCEEIPGQEETSSGLAPPKITLERTSNIKRSLIFIAAYLALETGKQLSNYGLSLSNDGQYPVSPCLIVVFTEACKLHAVLAWSQITGQSLLECRPSWKFCIPAACYFVTNLLYLHALNYVSPPLWMILLQIRTLYTAAAYKFLFGREVRWLQVGGCVLVVGSIPLARLSALQEGRTPVTTLVILISQATAVLSTVASIAVEFLLKNDNRSFCEQQIWLYTAGSIMAIAALPLQLDAASFIEQLKSLSSCDPKVILLVAAVLLSAFSGLTVPLIVKNLDSIVKDYLAALNNVALGALTAILFPMQFSFSWPYVLSLAMLLAGIFLYENKSLCKGS